MNRLRIGLSEDESDAIMQSIERKYKQRAYFLQVSLQSRHPPPPPQQFVNILLLNLVPMCYEEYTSDFSTTNEEVYFTGAAWGLYKSGKKGESATAAVFTWLILKTRNPA